MVAIVGRLSRRCKFTVGIWWPTAAARNGVGGDGGGALRWFVGGDGVVRCAMGMRSAMPGSTMAWYGVPHRDVSYRETLEMEIAAAGVQFEQQQQTCFQDLPESCISPILSFTTPKDVCSLAAVSRIFRAAANSDGVWQTMLPPRYLNILSAAVSPLVFSSKKELYFLLCDSILIDNGTKRLWLERPTGKICYMLSAIDLRITWGDDERYWRWDRQDDSRFGQVARLKNVCWLEVGGRFDSTLLSPNTDYCVSFVLKIVHRQYGWDNVPIKFSVTPPGQELLESSRSLDDDGSEDDEDERTHVIRRDDGWMEFVAGEVRVKEIGDGPTTHIEFSMTEVDRGHWKAGLLVDGVKIQPTQI
eukprot:Gb_37181 [translate_table: standard]